jgi:hypothetical protein
MASLGMIVRTHTVRTVNQSTSSLTDLRNSALVEFVNSETHCKQQSTQYLSATPIVNRTMARCALFGANVGLER